MDCEIFKDQVALLIYIGISALVCVGVSIVEILNRYSHAAKWRAVLFNGPAFFLLTINFAVGMLAVLAVDSAGTVDFNAEIGLSVAGFFKALFVGACSLAFLRSSFLKFRSEAGDMDFGPVAFLDSLKVMLDKRIDLNQKVLMDKEIAKIMKNVDPLKARRELPVLCLTGLNNCTAQDVQDMRKTIEDIFSTEAVAVRSLLIGHALYKFCGVEVLRSSVDVLGDEIMLDSTNGDLINATKLDDELLSQLIRIKGLKS